MAITGAPEGDHERRRHQQLEQSTAQEHERLARKAEQQMSRLVNRQVQAIEPPVLTRSEESAIAVDRKYDGENGPPSVASRDVHLLADDPAQNGHRLDLDQQIWSGKARYLEQGIGRRLGSREPARTHLAQ